MTTPNRALKRTSLTFRDIASATIRASEGDARRNIRRLLAFVEADDLLKHAVKPPEGWTLDAEAIWTQTCQGEDEYPFPDSEQEELWHLHQILVYFGKDSTRPFWQLGYGYAGRRGRNPADVAEDLLHDIVGKYSGHLTRILELALLDSSDPNYGPARSIHVNVSGGAPQVNIAQDSAAIEASHAINQPTDLVALLEALEPLLRADSAPQLREAAEAATALRTEVTQPKPNRFTLKAAVEKLELAARGIEAGSRAGPLLSKVVAVAAPYVQRLIESLSS